MIVFLGVGGVADRVGLARNTIKHYLRSGYLPEPDARIGTVAGFLPETVDRWMAGRPGRGARTDLTSARKSVDSTDDA